MWWQREKNPITDLARNCTKVVCINTKWQTCQIWKIAVTYLGMRPCVLATVHHDILKKPSDTMKLLASNSRSYSLFEKLIQRDLDVWWN